MVQLVYGSIKSTLDRFYCKSECSSHGNSIFFQTTVYLGEEKFFLVNHLQYKTLPIDISQVFLFFSPHQISDFIKKVSRQTG